MSKYAVGRGAAGSGFVTPASAQAVVEDPGYCAQFYPNANCQNYGPAIPVSRLLSGRMAAVDAAGVVAVPVRPHRRHHR